MIPAGFPALRLLARLPLGPAFPSPSTPEWQGVVRVLGLAKGSGRTILWSGKTRNLWIAP